MAMTLDSVGGLAEQVRQAAARKVPVFPLAGNTQPDWLLPAALPGVTLSLTGLNQLIDYPHQDMTITVQAGMTIARLQGILKEQGQTLPIDVPQPERATVGGSLAANINGPRRLGYGTWRDFIIGISWINDQGEEAKAGGRVVKNVAGYDFCKLFTGSLGTLGIITQVTLKVRPLFEKRTVVTQVLQHAELSKTVTGLLTSKNRPVLALITCDTSPQLILGFEDNAASVDAQVALCKEAYPQQQVATDPARLIQQLTEYPLEGKSVTVQLSIPRSQAAAFLENQQPLLSSTVSWQMQPLSGLLTAHLPEGDLPQAVKHLANWRQAAAAHGGRVTIPRCPAPWRSTLLPWGEPRPDWELMRHVKHAMDPHDIFQRGRHELFMTPAR